MVASSFLSFVMLMATQIGLPLGLPPLAQDPVLAQIAPQQCVWYFSSSGVAEPDSKSKNQTEQLLAEPEVRQFITGLGQALGGAIQKGAPPTTQGKVLGAEGPKLIHALVTLPTALFISNAAIGPSGPDISGGMIVGTGEQTEALQASLKRVEAALLGPSTTQAGDAKWHKLPTPPGMPLIEWGFRGKYLIVGVGAGSADGIASRIGGQTPAWLAAIKQRLHVERTSTVHYLNVKKIVEVAGPLLGEQGLPILEALGLGNVQQFANLSGLEGTGFISKSWVQVDGEPSGLLTVLGPEPLTAADLAPIPKDASFAVAGRIHAAQILTAIVDGMNKVDPRAGGQFASGLKQFEAKVGFRFKEDLLDTLGDSWCAYNSPGEGGLFVTGLTIVVPIKNHDRLVATNNRLVQMARLAAASRTTPPDGFAFRRQPSTEIKESTFQGQKILSLNSVGLGLPFAPAWCVTDTQLILSLSAQNIRAIMSRDPAAGSLADLPSVSEKLKAGAPVMLTYQDTAGMLKLTYPILQMVATEAFSEMQREGLDLDVSILPSLPSLLRHIEPGLSMLSREKDGLVYVSRRSSPVDLSFISLVPVWTGFMFMGQRSVESSRLSTPQTIELPADSELKVEDADKPAPVAKPAEKAEKEPPATPAEKLPPRELPIEPRPQPRAPVPVPN